MRKLPIQVNKKLDEITYRLNDLQLKRMFSNIEGIVDQMASGCYNYKKGSIEYARYAEQIAVRYINYVHAKLQKDLGSRHDRNTVPFREITARELFS